MCCRYGYETVAYYIGHTEEERIHRDTNLSNPMCNVFPTEVGFHSAQRHRINIREKCN